MKYILFLVLFFPYNAFSQTKDDLENRINGLTTIVESKYKDSINRGSGFFYYLLGGKSSKENKRSIDHIFLVTNRHVIFQKDKKGIEHMPDYVTFYLRSFTDSVSWSPITIPLSKLKSVVAVHKNSSVDIAVVHVMEFMPPKFIIDSNSFKKFNGVFDELLPNKDTPIPQVTDDVVVIGYPNGYYDYKNLFPIVKAGMIASKWGANFNGNPYFLIDSKLFPGSSGSLVLSKPSNFAEVNGYPMMSQVKQYTFLGIYSGNPYDKAFESNKKLNSETYDVGVVWYGYLVPEIINNGVYWK
jgi:hypothetical protein